MRLQRSRATPVCSSSSTVWAYLELLVGWLELIVGVVCIGCSISFVFKVVHLLLLQQISVSMCMWQLGAMLSCWSLYFIVYDWVQSGGEYEGEASRSHHHPGGGWWRWCWVAVLVLVLVVWAGDGFPLPPPPPAAQ